MSLLPLLRTHVIPAAYTVLPAQMNSREATAFLLAIALQESRAEHRKQIHGPARGLWQFESAGLSGVRTHPASRDALKFAHVALGYPATLATPAARTAIEHNDILAAVYARLLVWTLPVRLPSQGDSAEAWDQYIEAWRPGTPHPDTWPAYFAEAWALVEPL